MSSNISLQQNKTGLCPHGLPQSSCPICSKHLSGTMRGGSIFKQNNTTSNQWSYQKCYSEWLDIKSFKQHREETKSFLQKQFQNNLSLNKNIPNIKFPVLQNIVKFIVNSPLTAPLNFYGQKMFNILSSAGEKLVNILGEIKNFVERKILEDLKKKAKKFISFCLSGIEDENYQNDETLTIFETRERRKYQLKK